MRVIRIEKDILPYIACTQFHDEVSIVILKSDLLVTSVLLKKHINYQYSILTCISGLDLLVETYRFGIVYEFLSILHNSRLKIKVYTNETTGVKSLVSVYKNANWWEREVWDMFGIFIEDHPDLRRILTDYGFEGFPLRKDFPLTGYQENFFDANAKLVVAVSVELAQDFRSFTAETHYK